MQWNGVSHCEFDRKSMETETTTWLEFPNGEKAIAEQILASEEINKSKIAGLWESQSGIRVEKYTYTHKHTHTLCKLIISRNIKKPLTS